jgi:hypothetical protein
MNKEELNELTLVTLKEYAKGKIPYYYNLNKATLIDKLIKYEEEHKVPTRKFTYDDERKVINSNLSQNDPVIKSLEYPFSFIRGSNIVNDYIDEEDGYDVNDFIIPMPGEPDEEAGDFPNNITKYLWVYEGENDERPWLALVKLDNGNYAYYRGECDYTGFDCQGAMELYISKNLATLVKMAMTNEDYRYYSEN